ncbi:MAG: phytoene desaturase, partial [Alphaproteobacteria bacterium]|nr:phytoene desaturase [Alphaproteobacteria bacterium]
MTLQPDKVVVVGAGVGGLAAAMRLAHAGLEVTLADMHAAPGGKMRTLPSTAGPVDAGPTVLTMRSVFDALFEDVGRSLNQYVTLIRQETLARHFWPDGAQLDLHADPEASAAAMRGFAGPRAEAEFRAFSDRAARLFNAFEAPVMQAPAPTLGALSRHVMAQPSLALSMAPFASLAQLLRRQFSDPRLRQLFGRYATYVGGSPDLSPAILALIWHAEASGVWRVKGGMHRLARAMADVASEHGATLLFGQRATRIEMQDGRAAGVHLADGTRLACNAVVFAGDPRALATGQLGASAAGAAPIAGKAGRSLSANVWSFAARIEGPELAHHNVFFGADPRSEFSPLEAGALPEDPTLYICAEDRGTGSKPPELERFEIIMNAPPLPGGQPKDAFSCRTRTFPILRSFGLCFDPEPPDSALTTPAGFEALCPGSQGSLYGQSPHGLMAAFQRPVARTKIPGLYLAGGGAHPGAGVPMATLSGRHAAEAIRT